jgi:thioredoxin-dependent peroxiredoxin
MKTQLLAVFSAAAALFSVTSADAALKEGDVAPAFTIPASKAGKPYAYSLNEALKKGPVVVYFYPAAFTKGCSVQAHTFAENHDKFAAAGASIVGVSLDPIAKLNEFSADPETCAGQIAVASDANGAVAKSYELLVKDAVAGRKDSRGNDITTGYAERTTFVIDRNGRIAATVGGLAPTDNVQQALQVVQKLSAQAK